MKINNKEVKCPSSCKLNDKDYMTLLLTTLKDQQKNYCVALTEASNEYLFNMFDKHINNIIKMQRDTYQLMFQNGWYKLETSEKKKIKDTLQNLTKDFDSLK